MADSDELSWVEHMVLSAASMLPLKAYGVVIHDLIAAEYGSPPSMGTIYANLEKLEGRGYLESRHGEATPERGGRRKLYYDLTGEGRKVLRKSFARVDALRPDFAFLGGLHV